MHVVLVYEYWHVAARGMGYDAKATEWRAKLDALKATMQPATSQKAS